MVLIIMAGRGAGVSLGFDIWVDVKLFVNLSFPHEPFFEPGRAARLLIPITISEKYIFYYLRDKML